MEPGLSSGATTGASDCLADSYLLAAALYLSLCAHLLQSWSGPGARAPCSETSHTISGWRAAVTPAGGCA